ncbi:hypothetical protein Pmar_PMAR021880 [Perkinsus marinus ATCC 50983]|uniref:Uncharacterized protein n=1 Tax=Perkinsus marinus (strain ATCC 50983 / TXsc) TaxID=423536 RepID=C5LTJ6_PERM5|nr:hypothetical protein Pmar_PMAR021880 [Perkinsus marinus ATCC 50983]EEQ99946.1 hypothetical protein Pmar_PMAR021880 [Perkinsus marinus ATCC 50983]|eukprot:XP_002767229.1 hypothetical protein Pmar_PMAR021880 [Perkinsus marinus ATCC 50983]
MPAEAAAEALSSLYRIRHHNPAAAAGENLDLVDAATATSILVRLTTSTVIDGEKCSPIMLPSRFCDPVGESIVNCILRSATTGRHLSTRDLDRASQCLSGLARLQLRPADTEALERCLAHAITNSMSSKNVPFLLSIFHSMWKLDLKKAALCISESIMKAFCEVDAVRAVYCAACSSVPPARSFLPLALLPTKLTAVESSQLITALSVMHLDCLRMSDTLSLDELRASLAL